MIHPTALIDPKAQLDETVQVGPYAVIEGGVVMGPHCVVGPHVYLSGLTRIGSHNVFHAGAVVGNAPQDLKFKGDATRLRIGDRNVFREHVTVHRANFPDGETVIGSNNLFMASCHVAHDCHLGDHIILANGALLAGHVVVEDRAFISGTCLIHQFVRIGRLSMMQGGTAVTLDLPPYTMASQVNRLSGLNIVGLRRAGIPSEERLELRRLYHALFRSRLPLKDALASVEGKFLSQPSLHLIEFVRTAKRGIISGMSSRKKAAATDEEE